MAKILRGRPHSALPCSRICTLNRRRYAISNAAREEFSPHSDGSIPALDPSPDAVAIVKRRHTSIEFHAGEAEGHYDLVLVMDVIENVEDCFGVRRRLRPHGDLVVFHVPLEFAGLYLLRNVPMAHREALGHLHYFSKDTALALLADTG